MRCSKNISTHRNAVISVNNLYAGYDSIVLKNISFIIKKGDFIGIIGPNGSGKTTLLRCLAKFLAPKYGTILIDNTDIKNYTPIELSKKLAVVPQFEDLPHDFKIEDFVFIGRYPHLCRFKKESKKDYDIVQKSLELVKCLHLIGRKISQISGGERKKVIIARALAQNPEIILLDEPTSHLDINSRIEIMELLKKLSDLGLTVIIATHDINLAIQYCTKVILINDGKIVGIGHPEEILNREVIKKVFKVDAIIKKNPITNRIYVIPAKPKTRTYTKVNIKVHVVCGGGTGSNLMYKLVYNNFRVSAGVLNVLDSDWETAKNLGIQVVSEAPFSPISNSSYNENIKVMKSSDVIIITNVPFGNGNLKNLIAVKKVSKEKNIISIEKDPIEVRDFTNGLATKIYNSINNCKKVKNDDEALLILNRMLSKIKKEEKIN